jgi:hypothetical protein
VGVCPEPGAGLEWCVAPAGMGLELVVVAAQRRDVAVARRATGGGVRVVERDDVVVVAGPGGLGAPGEDAGLASSR